jgi:hypothetical protein
MNQSQIRIIKQIDAETRQLFADTQSLYSLLSDLAYSDGYSGDSVDAPDYGVEVLARLVGPAAKPVLKRIAKKIGGTLMEEEVDEAIRKYC